MAIYTFLLSPHSYAKTTLCKQNQATIATRFFLPASKFTIHATFRINSAKGNGYWLGRPKLCERFQVASFQARPTRTGMRLKMEPQGAILQVTPWCLSQKALPVILSDATVRAFLGLLNHFESSFMIFYACVFQLSLAWWSKWDPIGYQQCPSLPPWKWYPVQKCTSAKIHSTHNNQYCNNM